MKPEHQRIVQLSLRMETARPEDTSDLAALAVFLGRTMRAPDDDVTGRSADEDPVEVENMAVEIDQGEPASFDAQEISDALAIQAPCDAGLLAEMERRWPDEKS